ncbi:MAG: M3 family oligoendopeptidase, partial [Spirochaetota bacterium]
RYFLDEQLFFQQHQMSVVEESLAADLMRSGGSAWSRLFQSVSSTASAEWSGGRKTVTELRGLAFAADREVRRTAWQKELEAVEQVELPLAAALNGVKGFTVSLNRRRGYASALEKSVQQARISQTTLDALIGVMEEALPVFRDYLKGKARLLGLDRLAFYDLFAPVGGEMSTWTYAAARDFILDYFRSFSSELADFAAEAFAQGWIDARPRSGKVGGAYCISLPVSGETRILCNFSGNFGDVKTIAHELGHAYHHHVLRDAPQVFRQYPMTLAETASIFAESVVIDGALKGAEAAQKLPIVEKLLQDSTQVIVDILSRFKFEREVLNRRESGELAPEELKQLMLQAQRETYGDALNEEELHPYMWAVKPHYYRPELAFYNFPYAFGHLFGLGLYSRYQQEGQAFLPVYRDLLQQTGRNSAVEVTASAGFDIESPEFWRAGIDTIKGRVQEFLALL